MAPCGDGGVVGHEKKCPSLLDRVFLQKGQHPLPIFGVEVPRGLISKNDSGVIDQRSGNGSPLFFPTG